MTIDISEKYRITTDPYNFIVQELKQKKNGEECWVSVSFNTTLLQALQSLSGRVLRESDISTIDELKQLCSALTAALMVIATNAEKE